MSTPEEIAERIRNATTPEAVEILREALEQAAETLETNIRRHASRTAATLADTTLDAAEGVSDTAIAAAEGVRQTALLAAEDVSGTVLETAEALETRRQLERHKDRAENVALLMATNRMQRMHTLAIVFASIILTLVIVAANVITSR